MLIEIQAIIGNLYELKNNKLLRFCQRDNLTYFVEVYDFNNVDVNNWFELMENSKFADRYNASKEQRSYGWYEFEFDGKRLEIQIINDCEESFEEMSYSCASNSGKDITYEEIVTYLKKGE